MQNTVSKNLNVWIFIICSFLAFVSGTVYSQSVPSYVPTNGLVGWWGFNGNAQDESGNGNHGAINGSGISPSSDRFNLTNTAYFFNGSNSWISIPHSSSFNFGNSMTVSTWFYKTGVSSISCCKSDLITKNRDVDPNSITLRVNQDNGNSLGFSASSVGGAGASTSVLDNRWYHVVGTIDNGLVRIYVNGVLEDSATYPNWNIGSSPSPFLIGKQQGTGASNFFYLWTGKIDDIGLWNRALNQTEISNLFRACRITNQPVNVNASTNQPATFTVTTPMPNSQVQWQTDMGLGFQNLSNAGQYSGVTSSTLTVANTSLQNNNQLFRCIVTTPNCGSDTSDIVTLTVSSSGQGPALPRKFNYQAVVRDSMGALITNRNVSLRVTLLRGSAPHSPELFKETHQANTNATGLLTVKIGNGQSILGSMDSIDWSQGMVYLRTEIDPTGGNTFSVVNTAELLSVPYALYSLNSGGGPPGPAGPQGPSGLTGLQGVQGAPGNDGVGILSITNTGNNMVITLSNGNTYSVPIPNSSSQQLNHVKTLIYTTDGF